MNERILLPLDKNLEELAREYIANKLQTDSDDASVEEVLNDFSRRMKSREECMEREGYFHILLKISLLDFKVMNRSIEFSTREGPFFDALRKLSAHQREMILLTSCMGYPTTEAGSLMNISSNSAKKLHYRAAEDLSIKISEICNIADLF